MRTETLSAALPEDSEIRRPDGPAAPKSANAGAPDAKPLMAVTRLVLSEFRSYAGLRLTVEASPVVLTGANGAGKTNLLEALSYLAPGRGLRRARLTDVQRRATPPAEDGTAGAASGWAVAAVVATAQGPVDVGTGWQDAPAAGAGANRPAPRRAVRIDGAAAQGQSALADVVRLYWLTPEMDRLFVDAASGRRRFFDRLVYGFLPDHADRLGAYERALRQRSRLLRDGRGDAAWLAALENTMAEAGVAVAAARREVAGRLDRAAHLAIDGFPRPGVRLEGEAETWLDEVPALAAEDRLRAALAGSRGIDAAAGGAAHGPHRSDLRVRHVGRDMPAEMCSTGEQKALLTAVVLAAARLHAIERGAPPILLLDEIAAHLDRQRRNALFDEIRVLGAQAWMTGTDARLFAALRGRAQFLTVANSTVASAA